MSSNNTTTQGNTRSHEELLKIKDDAKKMMKDKLSAFYDWGVPAVTFGMGMSFFVKMRLNEVSSTWPLIMYLACLFVSFLINLAMKLRTIWQWWAIAFLSTILQICAATALMLFFSTTGTMTVNMIVWCLSGLVFILVIYWFLWMLFVKGELAWSVWLVDDDAMKQLDRGFEMSALVVAPSLAGLSGKVLGYVEGSNNLLLPEFFLFCSAVSGLLVVLFCTVPVTPTMETNVKLLAKVIPNIAYMALLFLVVATAVAADTIFPRSVIMVCTLIGIFAAHLHVWYVEADSSAVQSSERQDTSAEVSTSKTFNKVAISSILLAVMAIHSIYSGGSTVSLSWSWKCFVILALWSILSHTVRILILDQMTQGRSYEISMKFWTYGTFVGFVGTMVFGVLAIWLHPDDEFKTIF